MKNIKSFILSVISFAAVSMIMVSVWHFAVFEDHYMSIDIMRKDPLPQFALPAILLQGQFTGFSPHAGASLPAVALCNGETGDPDAQIAL